MTARLVCLSLLAAALVGCAGGGRPAPVRSAAAPPPPRGTGVGAPLVMATAGLEGVIGSSAASLARRFGEPRIDLAEGDVRKLQYAGSACVLDIYLYPLGQGAEPTATHVEARIRQGGATADAGACIRQIERR